MSENFERAKEELAAKVHALVQADADKRGQKAEVKEEAVVSKMETVNNKAEMSDTEKQARALGWKSKEERLAEGKSNTYYIEPDEYLRRQPLFDRIDRYGKEIKDLREMIAKVPEGLATIRQEAYEQALKDLEKKRVEAITDADPVKVADIEAQMSQTRSKMQADPIVQSRHAVQAPAQPSYSDDTQAFIRKHQESWYNGNTPENRRMVDAAYMLQQKALAEAQEKGIQFSHRQILEEVEKGIRLNFPHRFENPRQEAPALVGKSTSGVENISQTNSLVARLSSDQRRFGEHFVRTSNGKYTLEKYAAELEKAGRLK